MALDRVKIAVITAAVLVAVLYMGLSDQRLNDTASHLLSPADLRSSYVLLDVSEEAGSHIPGAVHINYTDLCGDDEILRPPEDLARTFGEAGISDSDSVVIYGECRPCGGSGVTLHPSTLTYFALLYLGHKNVWLLDGGINAWADAGRPTSDETSKRPSTTYTPHPQRELMASIGYIKNNDVQLVDARTVQEFETSTIPGSINIPADTVVSDGWFRDDSELEKLFRAKGLTKDRPVVVFTSTGVKASVVWFALKKMGYDARLFAMRRWVRAGETIVEP
ncbi:MAG TPA: rhodanese-like domain-containing protein [Methanothrix sp.]|nr:rhodanese-like domain-containing protein [Methanothrix sp.]HOL44783.1 rhodanese-like domain-containing protein [Methanothrix sp.]